MTGGANVLSRIAIAALALGFVFLNGAFDLRSRPNERNIARWLKQSLGVQQVQAQSCQACDFCYYSGYGCEVCVPLGDE